MALVSAVGGIVLLVALLYAIPAQPSWDDFCRAALTGGGVDHVVDNYRNWSGRWVSMFLYGEFLSGADLGGNWYNFALLSSFALWGGAFLLAVDLVLDGSQRHYKLLFSFVLLAIFWAGAPSQSDVFYWLTGITEYALPFLMGCLTIHLVVRGGGGLAFGAASLLGFLLGGVHELAAIMLGIVLSFYFLLRVRNRAPFTAVGAVIGLTGIGLLINVMAPGNAVRAEYFDQATLPRLIFTLVKPYDSMVEWLGDPRLIFLSALLILAPKSVIPTPPWVRSVPLWAIPVAALLVVNVPFALIVYLQGGQPSGGRVLDLLFAAFMLLWFAAILTIRDRVPEGGEAAPHWRAGAAGALALSLVTAPQFAKALQDLPEAMTGWRAAHDARWATLRAPSSPTMMVQDILPVPAPLQAQLQPDPTFFGNACLAQYFGIQSVRTIRPAD